MIPRTGPAGYTLLEVVLSLVLATLVLLCVAMAVDFQLRLADAGRTQIEEAQLARILLHRIADDIHATVASDPLGLKDLIPSISTSSGSAAVSSESTETASSTSESDSSTSETESSASTTNSSTTSSTSQSTSDPTQTLVAHETPGVYGGSYWLQLDVDRPTNLVRRRATTTGTAASSGQSSAGSLGDLKTVAYYVATSSGEASSSQAAARRGLIRRELERSITTWASNQKSAEQLLLGERLLAPEVVALEFRYSDGSTWYDTWDTAENEKLPLAVEITLTLQPSRQSGNWATALATATGLASSDDPSLVYRLVVDLPMARAGSATGASEDSSSSDSSDSSSSESSSKSSSSSSSSSSNKSSSSSSKSSSKSGT